VSKQNGAAVATQPKGQDTAAKTILIVEDNEYDCALLQVQLRHDEFAAESGADDVH
jgi:hypothetical protein